MAVETSPEAIRPTSTGAVTPDLSPVVQGIVADNSSTHTVHPEESVTFSNPAAENSSTNSVIPPGAVTFVNEAFVNPQPAPAVDADEPVVETKVVEPKKKPAPKTSKTAETK